MAGPAGRVTRADANELAAALDGIDLAYVDPPYNQHSYLGNYHVWETLVRWDAPDHYGVACKRADCRTRKSAYNLRRQAGTALADLIERIAARWLVVSFSDEGFHRPDEIEALLAGAATSARSPCRGRATSAPGSASTTRPDGASARSRTSRTPSTSSCAAPTGAASTAPCCRFRVRSFVMMEPAGIRPPAELRRDDMPQYMLLIYDEEAQRANATEEDMARVMQEYFAFTDA